ncbi:DUF6503 family protein [Formosa undariae]|uniref:DUF6503 family protein n=1 Tax=Formosa undariae TaxID=1325436 RepID=A0ABV5F5W7_9FLAO
MHILKLFLIVFSIGALTSCNSKNKKTETKTVTENVASTQETSTSLSESEKIINETILAHGGDLYNTANYSFVFRKNTFQFKNNHSEYVYSKTYEKEGSEIIDVLDNGSFSRMINGKAVELSDKDIASGTGSINSVIYFTTLPYKLNDEAVNSKLMESTSIKGEQYETIQVTFNEDGGGEDHDDEYYYWINKNTKKIDYLAYNYSVNKGGVRFRTAFNKRVVDGITFQDYINYEAEVGTPLKDLPMLFEANKLKELSEIKTENVINLNKQ